MKIAILAVSKMPIKTMMSNAVCLLPVCLMPRAFDVLIFRAKRNSTYGTHRVMGVGGGQYNAPSLFPKSPLKTRSKIARRLDFQQFYHWIKRYIFWCHQIARSCGTVEKKSLKIYYDSVFAHYFQVMECPFNKLCEQFSRYLFTLQRK